MDLRLCGGGDVVGDDGVRRIGAGVSRVPDRHHDQRHDGDDQSGSHHKLDHLRAVAVVVKSA